MEALHIHHNIKTYTLSVDEPHLSSTRNGLEISFRAGDQIIVNQTNEPAPGSLVLVQKDREIRLCRYEMIYGNQYLFPPLDIDPKHYPDVLIGQVIEHVRIGKWLSIER